MSTNNNLKDYLQNIANTFRGISGSLDLINPQNFSTKIHEVLPVLNQVTTSLSGRNLIITNNSDNGDYVTGYKIYDNTELITVQESDVYNLETLKPGNHNITVSAYNNAFNDSEESVGINFEIYNVTNDLTNLTTSNNDPILFSFESYFAILTPDEGYYLPSEISVTINGEPASFEYSSSTGSVNIYNVDGNISITAIASNVPSIKIYGVRGLYQSSPALTRTDDAVGMSAVVNTSTGAVSSDFDSVFPWSEATVETVDGNKFLKMPDMWFRIGKDDSNRITDVAVSKAQGTTGDWYKVDSFYYGCYGGSLSNSKLASVSGVARQYSTTRDDFRTYAAANGSGYHQLDLYHKTVMMFLWYIEWANKNSQSIMRGRDATYGNTSVNTGGTDSLSTPSGFNTSTGQMRWHYIEDFVGNLIEFVDGATGASGSSTYYVTADPSKFNDTGTGMNKLAYTYPSNASSSNRCVSALGWDDNNPFLVQPKEQTGTDYTIHFCDGNPASNHVVLGFGASYNVSTAEYGICYFYRHQVYANGPSIGGRLLYKP